MGDQFSPDRIQARRAVGQPQLWIIHTVLQASHIFSYGIYNIETNLFFSIFMLESRHMKF